MDQVVISLLSPGVPPRQIEPWVERHVDRLRDLGRGGGVDLGRLARSSPIRGGHWLIDVRRDGRDVAPEEDVVLAMIVTDMEALGLRPQVFVISREPAARRSREGHGTRAVAARRQPARQTRPDCRASSRVR